MPNQTKRCLTMPLLAASLLFCAAAPLAVSAARAQDGDGKPPERPRVSKAKAVVPSSTVNLINLLVKQGAITEEQAAVLIKQAEDETYVSREAARDATVKADAAEKAASAAAAAASPPGSKRVTYVPETVKRQLRDDLRHEVMAQARKEGWASPGTYPEWASRIRFSGDFRGRFEGVWYPSGYNSIGQIYDFNTINTGSAYDVSSLNQVDPPMYNTNQNRNRFRLRARLGMDADLYEGFSAGMRVATGSDSAPVSTNQTLGGSGGNFSKYAVWLDRAFVKFEPFKNPALNALVGGQGAAPNSAVISFGRFDNPFWAPTDLIWDPDLGFDGIAAQAAYEIAPGFTPFVAGGAFPIFNTSLDFATTQATKFKSADKYLVGGQLGFNWSVAPMVHLTLGAAVYEFSNVRGRASGPCDVAAATACDTDHYRPSFAQKGNTYMYLRDIVPPAGWTGGDYNQPQYFGLASGFRPAAVSGRLDFTHFAPVTIRLDGEYVVNTAFDRAWMERIAINNRAPDAATNVPGAFDGGNTGWLARLTVGNTRIAALGDWSAHVGYKYLESDAIMDAFADSDFGLGGTNLKGYFVGASYGLSQNVSVSARWLSANAISGAPYAVDIFQVDLNAKF